MHIIKTIFCISLLIFSQPAFAMESAKKLTKKLAKKFSSLSISKNSNIAVKDGKHLILLLERLRNKYFLPKELLHLIIKHMITDKDFFNFGLISFVKDDYVYQSYERNIALLWYLVHCKLYKNDCLEAIKKIFINNKYIPGPIDSLIKNETFNLLLAPYNTANFATIQRAIKDLDIKSLEKICNQPCMPANALWNYAFLFATYCTTGNKKKSDTIKELLNIIVGHADPIQNLDLNDMYECCPKYNNQSLLWWLRDKHIRLSIQDALLQQKPKSFEKKITFVIPHLCMNQITIDIKKST